MDCQKVYHSLSAYLHKELLPNVRVEIDEHLRSCHVCRQYLAALKQISRATVDMADTRAPAGIEENVLNAIFKYEIEERKWEAFKSREKLKPRWMLGFSLALSSLVLFLGTVFSSNLISPPQYANSQSENLVRAEAGEFDKADLVLDDPREYIKIVQDLSGDQILVFENYNTLSGTGKGPQRDGIDTIPVSPQYPGDAVRSNMVKTSNQIVF